MGIPIDGATHVYGVDMSVISKGSMPESVLKKKNNAVWYHTLCESVAMCESLTLVGNVFHYGVGSNTNRTDIF